MQCIGSDSYKFCGMEFFCDAIIRTDDGCSYYVHRIILSKNSKYFKALFLYDGRDQKEVHISLPWFTGHTMGLILKYIYTGKMFVDSGNLVDLFMASDFFMLDELMKYCQKLCKEEICLSNCVKMFIASQLNEQIAIFHFCRRFIRINFKELVRHPNNGIQDIPLEMFKTLLDDDSLNIPNELYIWWAIEQWAKNFKERLAAVPHLFRCIRIGNFNGHLFQHITKSDLIIKNSYFKTMNDGENDWDSNSPFKNAYSSMYPTANRLRQPKKLYFIVKYLSTFQVDMTSAYITYDEDIRMKRKLNKQLSSNFWPNYMVAVDHFVYMFNSWSNQAFVFNLFHNTLRVMEPMNYPRIKYNIVHDGCYIYAVGGVNDLLEKSETACMFERYDTQRHIWEFLGYTCNTAVGAALDGKVYIVGENPSSNRMIAKEYDPDRGDFKEINAPKISRIGFALISHGGQLFVIGGRNDSGYLKSVEVLRPQTGTWETFQPIKYRYESPIARIIDDKLVVYDERTDYPSLYWHSKDRKWKRVSSPYFQSVKKYLYCSIEDSNAITFFKQENSDSNLKWKIFDGDILV
ncbi:kelch-like protein 10 [Nephila pilipes]|uniref:Kelch-like protein 10 n=1 Tax=Nephila pilipes TaxID=299642 RepID=A0A8X6PCQ2_NEPPI|nr:kelch-like protein 10 [Nephila pilipes]